MAEERNLSMASAVRAWVAAHRDDSAALLLPTTAWSLQVAAEACSEPGVLAVGDPRALNDRAGALALLPPAAALREAQQGNRRLLVFSDQFVDEVFAPQAVVIGARETFLSTVEIVLHGRYHMAIWSWSASGLRPVPPGAVPILRGLSRLLHDAASLGSDWLAAGLQWRRDPGARLRHARQRARAHQSALLLAASRSPATVQHLEVAEALEAVRARLGRAVEPAHG